MANITPLPTPVPSTGDPENFDARADAFLGALPQFATEANQLAASLNNISTTSTSSTELTIGLGEKVLTVEAEKSYAIGQSVKIAVTADGTTWMLGEVTAYDVTTGELTVNVNSISGSGTYSEWTTTLAFDAPLANLVAYDNTASGLTANDVQAAIDESYDLTSQRLFAKSDPYSVAWERPTGDTVRTAQQLYIEVGGKVFDIPAETSVTVPTFAVGTDYAIWAKPDGTLEATSSFTSPPVAGSRWVGGFHYAPGGKATGTSGGDAVAQIMDTSFYDLKWRPSVVDPRGLVLVGDGSFWTGMYHMSANHLTGPVHKYNVDPCRDGNPPQNITAAGNYPNASPANIIEALQYHGFRAPDFWEFQLLAYGTTEATSLGGSGPGLTGVLSSGAGDKQRFTSQWGVFDSTGVLWHWGNDTILTTSAQTLPNPARGGFFAYSHFARFGGAWANGAGSGSRNVFALAAAPSFTNLGGRGVCDHLILV